MNYLGVVGLLFGFAGAFILFWSEMSQYAAQIKQTAGDEDKKTICRLPWHKRMLFQMSEWLGSDDVSKSDPPLADEIFVKVGGFVLIAVGFLLQLPAGCS